MALELELSVVNLMQKGILPIRENQEIDLFKLRNEAKSNGVEVKVEDDMETTRWARLVVRVNGVPFSVFRNGKVLAYGPHSRQHQEKCLLELWEKHLSKCVVKRKVEK